MKSLVKALNNYKEDVEEWAKRGVRTTTELLEDQIDDRVAVDSGTLKSANSSEIRDRGFLGIVTVDARIAPWLWYVEYGTGIYATGPGGSRAKKIPWTYYKEGRFYTTYGMAAQPFIYPSVDIAKAYFKNYFGK